MAKRKKKRSAGPARKSGCRRTTIKFKTKRGKVIEFAGKAGKDCGPRPKPKTGHLRPYKKEFARQAKVCKGRTRGAFLKCMSRMKGTTPAL